MKKLKEIINEFQNATHHSRIETANQRFNAGALNIINLQLCRSSDEQLLLINIIDAVKRR